ncbi:50S ribosomal protein L24 [Allorhodopirellula heiligendammensis]|uniref:Large ribosomal subunit protein uL24 n=1 Tax=Allorhodopirellula heiligendammensis TaxID=2714739 RepID=A0A5C6BYC3_9BACT|nr:50S ribosomal protein L24 [Allorhodopirellula heiligendammensis]TWU16888.1 50S ribosomal protein L24 [Allorhodopirellula heiligendammensis]|tara:strand:- start:559 stop:906 length:348 start_codon:yes stop_codon:yes gene_type:complete
MNFRIDDEVIVISGANKGHKGKIIKIDRDAKKVIVEGAAKVWKHVRQSQKNPQGGRLSKEMPICASNVMILDPSSGKPSRIGLRYLEDGSKERFAKKSGTSLGQVSPAKASRAAK